MTRRNPNISRTFLLLTVQEEINISHQNRTKINSQTYQEMLNKFESIEICFLNPPETGYIERKLSEHLIVEQGTFLIRELDVFPLSVNESDSLSSFSFEKHIFSNRKIKVRKERKEIQKTSNSFRIKQSLFYLRSLAKSTINKKKIHTIKRRKTLKTSTVRGIPSKFKEKEYINQNIYLNNDHKKRVSSLDLNIRQKEVNTIIKIPLSIANTKIKSHINITKYLNKSIKRVKKKIVVIVKSNLL